VLYEKLNTGSVSGTLNQGSSNIYWTKMMLILKEVPRISHINFEICSRHKWFTSTTKRIGTIVVSCFAHGSYRWS